MSRTAKTVAGIALAVLLAEFVCRFVLGFGDPPLVELDPEIEYMLVPSRSYERFGNVISVNAQRMRSPELVEGRPSNELRVLLIGDSVVYGNHRLDQSEIIGSRLQMALQERLACPVAVGSAAASSWGPANQLAFVERFGLYDANVVIVVQSSHDIADYPRSNNDYVPYRLETPKLALTDAALAGWTRFRSTAQQPSAALPYDVRRARSIEALGALLGLAQQSGANVVLAFHPTRDEALAGAPADPETLATYRSIAAQHGAAFFSFVDVRRSELHAAGASYLDQIHLSNAGADETAHALAKLLEDLGADRCPVEL